MKSQTELAKIFAKVTDVKEMETLLSEMLTDKERSDLALRWQLLKELYNGETQRSIAARHHISLCKITRGSKILKQKNSTVVKILKEKFGGDND